MHARPSLKSLVRNGDQITKDRTSALAVERLLLVLGEALVRIRDGEEHVLEMISEWRAIVGMRNAIVHGYDTIEPSRVRNAVNEDLPRLASGAREILDWPI